MKWYKNLAEALLDFASQADLIAWLQDDSTEAEILNGIVSVSDYLFRKN